MALKLQCACGTPFYVHEEDAGKRVECPRCKTAQTVEAASVPDQGTDVLYKVEGLSEQEDTAAPKKTRAGKPVCYFCGGKRKCMTFTVWTGKVGKQVEIRSPKDEIILGNSYEKLAGHDVVVCRRCGQTQFRRHRKWLLWVAVGQLALTVLAAIAAVGLRFLWNAPSARETLVRIWIGIVVMLFLLLGTICALFFSRGTFDNVEAALAQRLYRELAPDATAGLSSTEFKELQPQQINGRPRPPAQKFDPRSSRA